MKDYTGNTLETFCSSTGLTVDWVHSATDIQLNLALHNLELQNYSILDPITPHEIRQRVLKFVASVVRPSPQ